MSLLLLPSCVCGSTRCLEVKRISETSLEKSHRSTNYARYSYTYTVAYFSKIRCKEHVGTSGYGPGVRAGKALQIAAASLHVNLLKKVLKLKHDGYWSSQSTMLHF